jgi:hypothetical protein
MRMPRKCVEQGLVVVAKVRRIVKRLVNNHTNRQQQRLNQDSMASPRNIEEV